LTNPELFLRVGIKPPKGVLLYGPPGTGKTLLARAIASNIDANFLKVVSSAIVDKYIGESARLIREMFGKRISISSSKVMLEIINLVSYLWTKSMLSEENDSPKELLQIERFKEL
jgi:ATP-dependent 26S proteasome regulatory subunit